MHQVIRISTLLACLAAGAMAAWAQSASETPVNELRPEVSVLEVMVHTITPATDQLWSAWEPPTTPKEWRLMEEAAATLLAASSLTGAGGTGPMDNDWVKEPAWQAFNNAMIAAGREALEASRNKDPDALLEAGNNLLPPCEGCHQLFNPAVIAEQQ